MSSHTDFDPAGFGRSSAFVIGGAAFAVGASIRAAIADAKALADYHATEATLQEWQDTVAALRDALLSQIAENQDLRQEMDRLAAKHRNAASRLMVLEAENDALSVLA
jgi:hypothetical protein